MYHVSCVATRLAVPASVVTRPSAFVILLCAAVLANCSSLQTQLAHPTPANQPAQLTEQVVPADARVARVPPQPSAAAHLPRRDRAELHPRPAPAGSSSKDDPVQSADVTHAPADVGNPAEWTKQKAEEDRRDRELNRAIRSICRGC
jgi:type IV secretory pathway VirB10-like protein